MNEINTSNDVMDSIERLNRMLTKISGAKIGLDDSLMKHAATLHVAGLGDNVDAFA